MRRIAFSALLLLSLAACAAAPATRMQPAPAPVHAGKPYQVNGVWYTPAHDPGYDAVGIASWYGKRFHGRTTASGVPFDMNALSAAHRTLPFGTLVEVTNMANGRSVTLLINDRGPFIRGRIIDVSRHAAGILGFRTQGTARVRVRVVGQASG